MVYESDFYTTRRPYSSSRPTVTSYTVTTPYSIYPGVTRVHTYTTSYPIYSSYPTVYHRSIPFVAHKRLITGTRITTSPIRVIRSPPRVITSPVRIINIKVRPSVINREYQRIENKVRTHPHYYATENYLNSSAVKSFDDETRDIRNSTNVLLRKVHTRVQRATSLPPILSYASRYEDRYGPDSFISRVLGPIGGQLKTYDTYESPRRYAGKSHLASFRIVGDKCYAKRRPTTMYDDDKVRNDVNLLSYYLKNRKAASSKSDAKVILPSAKILDPLRATRKFTQGKSSDGQTTKAPTTYTDRFSKLVEEDIELEKKKAQRLEAAKLMEQQALEEEKLKREEEARQIELERQERLAAEAAAERAAEMERRRAEEEERERIRLEEEEAERIRLEEEEAERKRIEEEIERQRIEEEKERKRIEEEEEEERRRIEAEEERERQRIAEEERLAEEQRQREEELTRLAELERIAEEEQEQELARQAAELAEIARQQEAEAQRRDTDEQEEEEEEELDIAECKVDDVTNQEEDVSEPIVEEAGDEPVNEEPETGNADDSPEYDDDE